MVISKKWQAVWAAGHLTWSKAPLGKGFDLTPQGGYAGASFVVIADREVCLGVAIL